MAKQPNRSYTLSGRITELKGHPIENLLVRAFDQAPNTPDNPLRQPAITDAEEKYSISFTEEDFKIGGPDVFIRVFAREEVLGESSARRNVGLNRTINASDGSINNRCTNAKNKRNFNLN